MTGVNDIRSLFIDYFVRNGHTHVASSPLVPRDDPTLMFTNSGMVQFKTLFTGNQTRDYARAVTAQKCVRAGGKHNDLDNVGYTARHHTFFEMLGNFSFGDYFKEDAISFAWNLVTGELGLDPTKLLVTVYANDDEAFDLWRKIAGLSEHKILRIDSSDNFWAMGDRGPCGPCSEIFYDHGPHIAGGPPGSADAEGDRFIEIWNLVFMQFDQIGDTERANLPRPSIDTGMGLERIAAVLQGTHDNYAIDLFRHLIAAIERESDQHSVTENAASFRVIADHLRATSFLIADGVLPSNDGRGYVLRRIMRRAMRHAHILGTQDPLLWRLVPDLTEQMGVAYPELLRAQTLISQTLKLEEERFRVTLERGLKILDDASAHLNSGDTLDGQIAFKLYDTYGFPVDLTEDALRGRGILVDHRGFTEAMAEQKAQARKAWTGSGEATTDAIWYALREEVGATEFLGYNTETAQGTVVALVKDGSRVDQLAPGDTGFVITNQTPFYGESGGQVGDHGVLTADSVKAIIEDTQKQAGDLIVHQVEIGEGTLRPDMEVRLAVDGDRRQKARIHHSATHLLHAALRQTLGDHVIQKGSLVAPERLRFDFAHHQAVRAEELQSIQQIANQVVDQNAPVSTELMDVDTAIAAGAMALFGEKYGDEVRVVSMGRDLAHPDKRYSMELCGGTHVQRTGDIGLISIVGSSAVGSGVRRIEAMAGDVARHHLSQQSEWLRDAADQLKTIPQEVPGRIDQLLRERRTLERDLAEARRQIAVGGQSQRAETAPRRVGSFNVITRTVQAIPPKELRSIADNEKAQLGSGVVAIVGVNDEGKAALVIMVSDDLTPGVNAVELVRVGAAALGGKGGGGRPDMAQAGGPDGSQAEAALRAIEEHLLNIPAH